MRVDALAVGFADFKGRPGGAAVHAAEVLSRLPQHGMEVAYTPYFQDLMTALTDERLAAVYREAVALLERRGVIVPSFVHEVLEGSPRGLGLSAGATSGSPARRLIHQIGVALGSRYASLPAGLRYSADMLFDLYRLYRHLTTGDDYLTEGLKAFAISATRALLKEVAKVGALLNFVSEATSEFPVLVNAVKAPTYLVFQQNPFVGCSGFAEVARSLGLPVRFLHEALNGVPCRREFLRFYNDIIATGVDVSAIWVNPVSYANFVHEAPEVASRFKEVHVLYPAYSIDSMALRLRSYKKGDYLLFGGHFRLHKGLYDLPRILGYLKRISDVKVVITGHVSRGESEVVASKIKGIYPQAEFLGFIEDREELYRIYSGARALIYPSHMDSYSMAVLDSLGAGTPVVAYGIPELVHLYRGLRPVRLVSEYDFRAFAEELAKLAESDNTEELFNDRRTQEFTRLHSSWDNVAEQYVRILSRGLSLK